MVDQNIGAILNLLKINKGRFEMAKLNAGLAASFCVGILAGCGGGGYSTTPATAQTTIPNGLFAGTTGTLE